MRYIDEAALADITIGSTILGAGGGGDPYVGMLLAREAIREHGPVAMCDLDEVPDDARVVFIAGMGAPGVLVEKLPRSVDAVAALRELEAYVGYKFTHVAPAEAGGLNAVTPFSTAGAGLPVVDADGMGRAFPALELVTPTLYGGKATPLAMVDEHDNRMVINTSDNTWAENLARAATLTSGCVTMMALYPMTGRQAKDWLVKGALSLAERIGRTLREARAAHEPPVEAVMRANSGVSLFEGKVTEVDRRNEGGWTIGEAVIEGSGAYAGSSMTLHFQNEHLAAVRDGQIVATVPDLIMALAVDSGEPIPAEEIRYGYRVAVIGMPCDWHWRTPEGLALSGPRRFGYDMDFVGVEERAVTSA
ncbi:DUF917 domain-containing protein [Streptosporangium sp. NPDC051022]|uniref:DUF917 domain-containing protein n=1 Tax=Streptosporangium sp. NPDC051022 TaxID=3155752 RepID=UPI00341A582C